MGKFSFVLEINDDDQLTEGYGNQPNVSRKIHCMDCKTCCSYEEFSKKHKNHSEVTLVDFLANYKNTQSQEEKINVLLAKCSLVDHEIEKINDKYLKFDDNVCNVEAEIGEWSRHLKDSIDQAASDLIEQLKKRTNEQRLLALEKLYETKEKYEKKAIDTFNNVSSKDGSKNQVAEHDYDGISNGHVFSLIYFKKPGQEDFLVKTLVGTLRMKYGEFVGCLITSLDVGFPVAAMAVKESVLYVLGCNSPNISAFNSITFAKLYSFNISNLSDPYDMEILNSKVYITECDTNKMHIVDLQCETSFEVEIPMPFSTLSVTNWKSILVTGYLGDLTEYFLTGVFFRKINLSHKFKNIYKTVEINNECYMGLMEGSEHKICILDKRGRHLLGLISPSRLELVGPCYLVVDYNKNIYVCDHENQRILIYNSELRFAGCIEVPGRPFRLCVDNITMRLYVSYIGTNEISVYKLPNI